MSEPALYDAHVFLYIEAKEVPRENVPVASPQNIELRRGFDLGAYSLEGFADLMETAEEAIEEWVAEHPPV